MEKLPFSFGYPFFMRVFLPGVVVLSLALPLIVNLSGLDVGELIRDYYHILLISAFILGSTTFLLDLQIYMLFEGRYLTLYLPRVAKFFVNIQQNKISRVQLKVNKMKQEQYIERERELRALISLRYFPAESGFKAKYPTILGNILIHQEDLPWEVYGMDPSFFWAHIWLVMDEKQRKEIELIAATLDGVIYISFVFLVLAMIYLTSAFGLLLGKVSVVPKLIVLKSIKYDLGFFLPWGLAFLGLTYLIYRLSFTFAQRKGDFFRAMFDLHRKKVYELIQVEPKEFQQWKEMRDRFKTKR